MTDPDGAKTRRASVTPRSLAAMLNPDVARQDVETPDRDTAAAGTGDESGLLFAGDSADAGERKLTEYLTCRCGSERFALPIGQVLAALDRVEPAALPEMPPGIGAIVNVSGRSLPLLRSELLLGVAASEERPSLLVLASRRGEVGLPVDELLGPVGIDADSVQQVPALEDPDGAFGGVFFLAGDLVTVINATAVDRILRRHAGREDNGESQ